MKFPVSTVEKMAVILLNDTVRKNKWVDDYWRLWRGREQSECLKSGVHRLDRG